jgi:quercetin dioxygenase-like cupin family protein
MNRLRSRHAAIALVAVLGAVVATGVAIATPPIPGSPPPVATPVQDVTTVNEVNANIGELKLRTKEPIRVVADDVTVGAGWSSGWHSHSGFVIFAVKAGTLTLYDEDCNRTTLTAGQAFIEEPHHVVVVRNESGTTARFVPTQILPVDAPLRIDFPQALCGVA